MFDDTTSYSLLKNLEENPTLSQRQLAKRMGVSLGKVNFCINALIRKGFLKVGNFQKSGNKLAYIYLLTPHGVEHKARLTVEFIKIKTKEYERLRMEIAMLKREAGQNAGEKYE